MPTLAEIVDAVWSTEIQPGLTAREILAAWLRLAADGLDLLGVGQDEADDIEQWHAAGRKAAARFAPQINRIIETRVLGTTSSPGATPRATRATPSTEHDDEYELLAMLLLA